MADVRAAGWAIVIPVKHLATAKGRLRGAVPADRHAELVLALLRDTLAAAVAVAPVTVVTADPVVGAAVRAAGGTVVVDPGGGLNHAVGYAADTVLGLHRHRAALTGDLPALRPEDLVAALAAMVGRGFVADAAGTGTVLLGAQAGVPLGPCFGPGSAAAHRAGGAAPLAGAAGLRHDVDTPADLRAALALGPAQHTRALVAACAVVAGGPASRAV